MDFIPFNLPTLSLPFDRIGQSVLFFRSSGRYPVNERREIQVRVCLQGGGGRHLIFQIVLRIIKAEKSYFSLNKRRNRESFTFARHT